MYGNQCYNTNSKRLEKISTCRNNSDDCDNSNCDCYETSTKCQESGSSKTIPSNVVGLDQLYSACIYENQSTDFIISCNTGYCINVDSSNKMKCIKLSTSNGYFLKDTYHFCRQDLSIRAIECADGYCLSSEKCYKLDANSTNYIGKHSSTQQCQTLNSSSNSECATNGQICLDNTDNNKCVAIDGSTANRIGRNASTKVCQPINVANSDLCTLNSSIFVCLDNTASSACVNLDISITNRIGRDKSTSQCLSLNQPNSLYCANGQICKDPGNDACVNLDISNANRIGREKTTFKCLKLDEPNSAYCADGLICRDPGNNACVNLSKDNQNRISRLNADKFHECGPINVANAVRCAFGYFCLENGFCQQTMISNSSRISREAITGKCLPKDQSNSILCAEGKQCLNSNGKCQDLDDTYFARLKEDFSLPEKQTTLCSDKTSSSNPSTPIVLCASKYCFDSSTSTCLEMGTSSTTVGREKDTTKCLQKDIPIAEYCSIEFCLFDGSGGTNYQCAKLDSTNANKIGREKNTSKCLQKDTPVADQCSLEFCLFDSAGGTNYSCTKLDNTNPNKIGREKDTSKCLQKDTPITDRCSLGFCLFDSSGGTNYSCTQLDSTNPGKIGRDITTHLCLQKGASNSSECADNFCLKDFSGNSQKQCYELNSDQQNYIGKQVTTQDCLSSNSASAYQCAKKHCLDINDKCQLMDATNPSRQIISKNHRCAPLESDDSIDSCAYGMELVYCKDNTNPTNVKCIDLNSKTTSYLGVEYGTQLCIDGSNANAAKCKTGYCVNNNTCVPLAAPQFNGKSDSHLCLTQSSVKIAIECVTGYCIYLQECRKLDASLKMIGKEVKTQLCLDAEDPGTSNLGSIECVNDLYCLETNGQSLDVCVRLDPLIPNRIVRQKNQRCADSSNINADKCALGYCLIQDITNNIYKCIKLGEIYNSQEVIGRQKDTTFCVPVNAPDVEECFRNDFCIFNNGANKVCKKLDMNDDNLWGLKNDLFTCVNKADQDVLFCAKGLCLAGSGKSAYCIDIEKSEIFIGREKQTSRCLRKGEQSTLGIDQCSSNYCELVNTNSSSCQPFDYDSGIIGIVKDSNLCLTISQVTTTLARQCLTKNDKCVELGTTYCAKSNNECINANSGQCAICSFSTCKEVSTNKCVGLTDNGKEYCQSISNDACINAFQIGSICLSCPPIISCYDPTLKMCQKISTLSLDNDSCIQVPQMADSKGCAVIKMSQEVFNEKYYCASIQNECLQFDPKDQNPSVKKCFRCPKPFIQPGNLQCYSSNFQSSTGGDPVNKYFGKLTLIKNRVDCGVNDLSCTLCNPNGTYTCRECIDSNTCTKCAYGYFLHTSNSKTFCIQCPSTQINATTGVTNDCADCLLSLNDWSNLNANQFSCKKQLIGSPIQNLANKYSYQYTSKYDLIQSYQIQNNQVVLYVQAGNCNVANCDKCEFSDGATSKCLICLTGYALDLNLQCVKCDPTCKECYFGGMYNDELVDWTDPKNKYFGQVDLATLEVGYEYVLLCRSCLNLASTFNVNFQKCEPCGLNCQTCHYGLFDENLLESNRLYKPYYYKDKNFLKKCDTCKPKFVINYDGVSCVEEIKNCVQESFFEVLNGKEFYYSIHPFPQYPSSPIRRKCLQCTKGFQISVDGLECAITQNPLTTCNSYDSNNKCMQCTNQMALKLELSTCNNECFDKVNNCSYCYEYTNGQDFTQCVQCKDPSQIPSIGGCTSCFSGCQKCYEGTKRLNMTASLIYDREKYSFQERVSLRASTQSEQICTVCNTGLYLKNNKCEKQQCGDNCAQCVSSFDGKYTCQACNYNNFKSVLEPIIPYIEDLYQIGIQIEDLVHFTEDGLDCMACPFACKSCSSRKDISFTQIQQLSSNFLNLYDTSCYACRSTITRDNYQIDFDQKRGKCYFKEKTEGGCEFVREKIVYLSCKDKEGTITGDGSKQKPYNLEQANLIDWDTVILDNTQNFNETVIYYNELSVREITLNIYILDENQPSDMDKQKCELKSSFLQIKSNLLQYIKTVENFHIRIQPDQANQYNFKIIQSGVLSINGFNNITIERFQFKRISDGIPYFGLELQSTLLKSVLFKDIEILEEYEAPINIAPEVRFINTVGITIKNLQQNLTLQNFMVRNINFDKKNLFYFEYSETQSSSQQNMLVNFYNTTLQKMYLVGSQIMSFKLFKTNFTFDLFKITGCTIKQSKILYHEPFSLYSTIDMRGNNLQLLDNNLMSMSMLMDFQKLNSSQISNVLFQRNNFTDLNQFIKLNGLHLNQLRFMENNLQNSIIFKQQIELNQFWSRTLFNLTDIKIEQNQIGYSNKIFDLQGQDINNFDFSMQKFVFQNNHFANSSDNSVLIVKEYERVLISDIDISDNYNVTIFSIQIIKDLNLTQATLSLKTKQSTPYDFMKPFIIVKDFAGQLDITEILVNAVIISESFFYFQQDIDYLLNAQNEVKFQNITIKDSQLQLQNSYDELALIFFKSICKSSILLNNLTLTNNILTFKNSKIYGDSAAGLHFQSLISHLTIMNSLFKQNQGQNTNNQGAFLVQALELQNTIFQQQPSNDQLQQITDSLGGNIFVKSKSLKLDLITFKNGVAKRGGGVFWQALEDSEMNMVNSTFSENVASLVNVDSIGGALYIDTQYCSSIFIQIINSYFINNKSGVQAGAIYMDYLSGSAKISFNRAYFINNQANLYSQSLELRLFKQNSIIVSNSQYISISNCEFNGKKVQSKIPQIFIDGSDKLAIEKSKFISTSAIQKIINAKYIIEDNNTYSYIDSQIFEYINVNSIELNSLKIFENYHHILVSQNCLSIKLNKLQLYQNTFKVENLEMSQTQGPFIQIDSQQFTLENSRIENNINSNGILQIKGKTYTQINPNIIQNSNFTSNKGTSVLLYNAGLIVDQNDFSFNEGVNGGAIQQIVNEGDRRNNLLILTNSKFMFNKASKSGGAVYIKGSQVSYQMKDTVTFEKNKAQIFGDNIVQDPVKMHFVYQELQDNLLQKRRMLDTLDVVEKHKLINFKSGSYFPYIVQLLMEDGTPYYYDNSELPLYLNLSEDDQVNQPKTRLTVYQIQFNQTSFNLTDKLYLVGILKQTSNLKFQCDLVKVPTRDPSGMITQFSDSYSLQLPIYYRECQKGEEYYVVDQQQSNYQACKDCPEGYYSLKLGVRCKPCDSSQAICRRNIIKLKYGYWRSSEESDVIVYCKNKVDNCVGNINQTIANDENFYCTEGHIGALCEDCDLEGKVWGSSYSMSGKYECMSCSSVSGVYTKFVLILLFMLVMQFYMVNQTIKFIESTICSYYLQRTGIFSGGRSVELNIESGIYVKILMNYIQIISILTTFNLKLPEFLDSGVKNGSNPLEVLTYSQDCFLHKLNTSMPFIYFRVIWSQVQSIGFIVIFLALYRIFIFVTKRRVNKGVIYCSMNQLFIQSQPGITNLVIGTISCRYIGENSYVKDYTANLCDSLHYQYVFYLLIPILFIWAILIPFYQLYSLYKNRSKLNQINVRWTWGFLYNEYNFSCYYWELVKILQKLSLIIVLNLYDEDVKIKGILAFVIVFMYMAISLLKKPYSRQQLNRIDIQSTAVCSLSIVIGVMVSYLPEEQNYLIILSYLGLLVINAWFILMIISKMLSVYSLLFQNIFNKIKRLIIRCCPCCKKYLKINQLTISQIRDKWKFLRLMLRIYIKKNQHDQNKKNKSIFEKHYNPPEDLPLVKQHQNEGQQSNFGVSLIPSDTQITCFSPTQRNASINKVKSQETQFSLHSNSDQQSKLANNENVKRPFSIFDKLNKMDCDQDQNEIIGRKKELQNLKQNTLSIPNSNNLSHQNTSDLILDNDQIMSNRNSAGSSGGALLEDQEDILSSTSQQGKTRQNSYELSSPLTKQTDKITHKQQNKNEMVIDIPEILTEQYEEHDNNAKDRRRSRIYSNNFNKQISVVQNSKPMLLIKKEQMKKLMAQDGTQNYNRLLNLDIFRPQPQIEQEMKKITHEMRENQINNQLKQDLLVQYELSQINLQDGYKNPQAIKQMIKDKYKILNDKVKHLINKCSDSTFDLLKEKLVVIQSDMGNTYNHLKKKKDQKSLKIYLYGIEIQVKELEKLLSDEL